MFPWGKATSTLSDCSVNGPYIYGKADRSATYKASDRGAIWEDIQMTNTPPIGWFVLAAGWSQRQVQVNRTMQYVVLLHNVDIVSA